MSSRIKQAIRSFPSRLRPSLEDVGQYTGDAGADYWRYQEQFGRRGARLDLWKFDQRVRSSDRVLDFGCGGAFLLERLSASEKIGIEINPSARQAARDRGLDVRASTTEVPDNWADIVISNHALEHTLAPCDVLVELRRTLRPTGQLAMYLPLDDWRVERDATGNDIDGHLYTWTPRLFANLLTVAGFEVDEISVVTRAFPPNVRVLEADPRLERLSGMAWSVLRRRRQLFGLAHPR